MDITEEVLRSDLVRFSNWLSRLGFAPEPREIYLYGWTRLDCLSLQPSEQGYARGC